MFNMFNTNLGTLKNIRRLIILEGSGTENEFYPSVVNDGGDEF
jgi:hypothetical protein